MVKKITKAGVAVLAVASLFTMTAFAEGEENTWNENGASTTVTIPSYTVDPVIEVELPGELEFGINPLSLDADEDGEGDDQIISGEYVITNYSNVPVLIETTTTLTGGENVEIVTTTKPSTESKTGDLKSSEGKKAIWMVQLLPTKPANLSGTGDIFTVETLAIPTGTGSSATVKGGNIIGSDDTSASKVLFRLDANTGETSENYVSGFKFAGLVDPTKTFDETDNVKITTVYKLNTLSKNQYEKSYTVDTKYKDNPTIVVSK